METWARLCPPRTGSHTMINRISALVSALAILTAPIAHARQIGQPGTPGGGSVVIGGGGPGGGGFHPETFSPPNAPKTLGFAARAATSLTPIWYDRSDFEDGYEVFRQGVDGGWSKVGETDSASGWPSFEDGPELMPDTPYCYRVRAFNSYGNSAFSPVRCAYTRDGNDNAVWRAVLVLETANIENADTEDDVRVRLNGATVTTMPSSNHTWLDYARDDFERATSQSFDLNLTSVGELGDINQITIAKPGDDGWCLRGFTLEVNGFAVYGEDFSGRPAGCLWLENSGGHSTWHTTMHTSLRQHPLWRNYNEEAALLLLSINGIPNQEIVSRIEAIVGNSIHGNELYWGHLHGPGVEVERGCPDTEENCQKVHVDLDLAAEVTGRNPGVDVDFDLEFDCDGGSITIESTNVEINADSTWFWEVLSLGLINLVDREVENRVEKGWQNISKSIDGVPDCRATVNLNGDVFFELIEPPAQPRATAPRARSTNTTMRFQR